MNPSDPSWFWPPAVRLFAFDGPLPAAEHAPASDTCRFAGATWRIDRAATTDGRLTATATVVEGDPTPCALAWEVGFTDWSTAIYVLLPGAVYAGNRFPVRRLPYSPRISREDAGPQPCAFVTDVPRLSLEPGPSALHLLAGDLAEPLAAFFDPRRGEALVVRAPSHAAGREVGFSLIESDDRRTAVLRVSAPGVRPRRYVHMTTSAVSPDRGATPAVGDSLVLAIEVEQFTCADVPALFARLFARRGAALPRSQPPAELPFSAAFDLIEEHYNRDQWWPAARLYASWSFGKVDRNPFQIGWCGGIIPMWALAAASGDPLTRNRLRLAAERIANEAFAPSGLIYGKCSPELRFDSDCWYEPEELAWRRPFTLTRRQGDALYYALRMLAAAQVLPANWAEAFRGHARALAALWRREGQFGHFLNQQTGRVEVGGTTSGGLIPGALALASRAFDEPALLDTARESLRALLESSLPRGVTTGGPGDALQVPDSESVGALVESAATLFELTREPEWADWGVRAAHQLASWVMPYDYPFPPGSEFGRLGLRSAGTVFANAQNKHSAPGICTHSGAGLLRLFRATGDRGLLDLVVSIARALPQFVSRPDRPIHAQDGRPLPAGWINERVNTSDWDNNLGGVFWGSCWCEISLLLSRVELPGVYAQPDTGVLAVIDHVEAAWSDSDRRRLRLHNPTRFAAEVRLWVETSTDARRQPLPANLLGAARQVALAPGASAELTLHA